MCPPPAEPIRPVNTSGDDMFIGRIRHAHRVTRRTQHEATDDEDERRRSRHEHAAEQVARWRAAVTPAPDELDAGTYDDHGRVLHHDDEPARPQRHVDASA